MQHDKLICDVKRMEYDFNTKIGILFLEEGNCTQMDEAIKLFTSFDPKVKTIYTVAGDEMDIIYIRDRKKWEARELRELTRVIHRPTLLSRMD